MGKTSTKPVIAGMAALMMLSATTATAQFKFNAVVSFPTESAGVYGFTTADYNPTQIKRNVYASGGGVAYSDGNYYGVRVETVMGITAVAQTSYKMSTWEVDENYTGKIQDVATAIAYNRDYGQAYGCYYNEDGETFRFCSVNVPYWGKTKIADLPKAWGACAIDANGTLYAIDEDGILGIVNTDNGEFTAIGDTGLTTEWITGAIIDTETGNMLYAIKTTAEAAIYSVNLTNASATKLYDLANEEQLGGFFIPENTYEAGVPGAAYSAPSPSFSNGSLSGTVRISGPSGLYDGTTGSGDITYHLYANGKEVATGTRGYGSYTYTTVNVDLPAEGSYCFAVSFSNEAGEGPRRYADTKYIGMDTPKAPASVSVSYADGKATVKWGSVSSGMHNGTIDRANLIYRVTRWPEGIVVSPDDQKLTSLVDEIAMPETRTSYWYTVEAVTGEKVSPATKSSSFELGPIEAPYATEFTSATDYIGYSSLSPDGKLWQYNSSYKCAYVSTSAKPADNWLILPVARLKGGNSYEFALTAHAYSNSYTEQFEVKFGTEPTVEAMTASVIETSSVADSTPAAFSGHITPDADGLYYIGIHAVTPTGGGYLYIDGISIAAGISHSAPAAVSDLAVTAADNGAHIVTATFTTPSLTIGGKQLDAITRIDLLCDGEVVNSIDKNITVGGQMSISDNAAPAGKHTYSVICHNDNGTGSETQAEVFVGFSEPVATDLVTMTESRNGHVVATWSPVTKDSDGRTLSQADVRYNIYEYLAGDLYTIAENVEGTTCEYDAFAEFPDFDGQRFIQTIVEAVTEGGVSKKVPSAMTAVGNPYVAPWSESFANCSVNSIFANEKIKGNDIWQMVAADDFGTTPADNDGGMMYFEAYGGGSCGLVTGKIDLGDIISPAFIFQVFNYLSSSPNENIVSVDINAGDGYVNAFNSTVMECGTPGQWNKVTVPLDEYAGQTVTIRISATNKTFGFTHIDDLRVTSVAPYNLGIRSVDAPSSVERNTGFDITVEIENLGLERALGYKVNLLRNGEFVDSRNGQPLDVEESATFTFTDNAGALADEELVYTAEIEYGPDMFEADNSASVTVLARTSALPAVTGLDGQADNGSVLLTWNEPADLTIGALETETFDAPALSWATQVPGWTFHDLDGGTMGGIGNKQLPVSGRQSFFVFDNTLPALQTGNISAFNAHSGNQYLCSMYARIGSTFIQSDDWAVSPELTGEPQVVTLYATSFPSDPDQPQYLETFQILSSTTGNKPEDFTLIEEFANIPAQWRQYSAYLPEGTRYFAIRCTSADQYMLFVDDVTFAAKNGNTTPVSLIGYNIYRDAARLNSEPVTGTSFIDNDTDGKSTYTYTVTSVYAEGESNCSNSVKVDTSFSGIGSLSADNISIFTVAGAAVVTGAEGLTVEVFTADGKAVAAAQGAARTVVPLAGGFYIVKAGNTAAKIVVK